MPSYQGRNSLDLQEVFPIPAMQAKTAITS